MGTHRFEGGAMARRLSRPRRDGRMPEGAGVVRCEPTEAQNGQWDARVLGELAEPGDQLGRAKTRRAAPFSPSTGPGKRRPAPLHTGEREFWFDITSFYGKYVFDEG